MKTILAAALLTITASPAMAHSFSNSAAIAIPTIGNVFSTINVSGLSGDISALSVNIYGLEHTFTNDLVIGIVNETHNVGLVFMSYVGGSSDVNNITLTFSDLASYQLPESYQDRSPFISGTYLASNFGDYSFDGYQNLSSFVGFNGLNPNGDWTLVVADPFSGDGGAIGNGWSIDIATTGSVVPEPATWAMMLSGFGLAGAAMRRKKAAASFA